VKTDVWHQGELLPIGYEIADACVRKGLRLRAHWIWQRLPSFSPYSPAFSNVFIFADRFTRPFSSGLIAMAPDQNGRRPKASHVGLFGTLIDLLSNKQEVVIDPFAGTGSVMEAADMLGRRSVGVELSKIQVRLALGKLKNVAAFVFRGRKSAKSSGGVANARGNSAIRRSECKHGEYSH
jgi:DNA modification methylase